MKLHCFFCAGDLQPREADSRWSCSSCGALFRAELDPEGCVLRLEVSDCGTPDCCRHEKN